MGILLIVQGRIVEKITFREEAGQLEDLSSFSVFLFTLFVPWILVNPLNISLGKDD